MMSAGIGHLKNNLSRYVRRIEAGERIAVTAHGRVVAELGPPATTHPRTPLDELIATGLARAPIERGDPLADWPKWRLPAGFAAALIDEDRGEA